MSSRQSRRSTPNSTSRAAAAIKGNNGVVAKKTSPSTAQSISTQNSIRSYFTPLSQTNSNASQTQIPHAAKVNGVETRRTSKGPPTLSNSDPPPKPPTKLTVTQPHGAILQTTNGVRSRVSLTRDDLHSGSSTPRPDGSSNGAPTAAGSSTKETRTLRSKDGGSRLKSDLAIYFAGFDDIISDAPKPPEFLRVNEPIYVIDEAIKTQTEASTSSSKHSAVPIRPKVSSSHPALNIPGHAKTIPVSVLPSSSSQPTSDPLPDTLFFKPHRRAERKEKQLRNIEKERAMHEKVHLERLLDGLKGPDWLRVMGVTGITEGEQKDWKPKREYFISEVNTLVEKFRLWKEEEKRLRLERERAREEEEEEEEDDGEEEDADGGASSSDIDASAARQLQLEAGITPRAAPQRRRPLEFFEPPSPEGPFVSFYSKPHLRAAAMGSIRQGRNVTAFGRPIPDFEEHEFSLPDDYITPEAIRANARKRRRLNREVKEAESEA